MHIIKLKYTVSQSTHGFLARFKTSKSALLDKQGNNRWHSWRLENKVIFIEFKREYERLYYCTVIKENYHAEKHFQ